METQSFFQSSADYNNSKEIIIKLSESTYAHSFEDCARIHAFEYKRALDAIDNQINGIQKHSTTVEEEKQFALVRKHNTIAIFGGRGSGKTSFLHTVFAECAKKYEKDIEILKIVDPTLIETRGHVFLWIISLLNEKVEAHLSKGELNRLSPEYTYRKQWEDAIHTLARGLHSLENVGVGMKNEHWHDDYFVVESGLQQVGGALNLEANFRKLIDTALGILKKKAFLIAFDDIDVDMEKGWPVMETIRKYLTTDKIIVLLTGNLKLYSLNVRRHQWEQLGKMKEWEDNTDFKTVINEIEGQYLMKLLKAENRVFLHSIMDNIRSQKYKYVLEDESNPSQLNKISIEKVYREALAKIGIVSRTQSNIFCNYLLSLSARSQIHFLRSVYNEKSYASPRKAQMVDPFMARMYAANIDIDFAINNPQMINIVVLRYILKQKFDLYLLLPTVEDENVNCCVTGLSFLCANKMSHNPYLIFDYFIRIGYVRNVLLSYQNIQLKENFCSYSGMFQDISLKNIVGLSMAYADSLGLAMHTHIPLYTLTKNSRTTKYYRIDDLLSDDLSEAQTAISFIPLCSLRKMNNNEHRHYYSLFNILAAIGQILRVAQTIEDGNYGEILRELKDLQIHRYYAIPSEEYERSNINESIDREDSKFDIYSKDNSLNELAEVCYKWSSMCQDITLPPYLLGKIITRYMNAAVKITSKSLGEQINNMLIIFLNACLIEEVKEFYAQCTNINNTNEIIEKINFANTITSFEENLKFISEKKAQQAIKFTQWLMNCPLITPFIDTIRLSQYRKFIENGQTLPSKSIYKHHIGIVIKEYIPFYPENIENILQYLFEQNKDLTIEQIRLMSKTRFHNLVKQYEIFKPMSKKSAYAVWDKIVYNK